MYICHVFIIYAVVCVSNQTWISFWIRFSFFVWMNYRSETGSKGLKPKILSIKLPWSVSGLRFIKSLSDWIVSWSRLRLKPTCNYLFYECLFGIDKSVVSFKLNCEPSWFNQLWEVFLTDVTDINWHMYLKSSVSKPLRYTRIIQRKKYWYLTISLLVSSRSPSTAGRF